MKIFLFFIICSFSCGEQKPVNEDITEATVAPVNIESVENNRNIFNISKKDVLSSRFMQNTSLKTDTLNVNSAKSNIFKIPLLNAGSSTAHISTASTNLNNTIVMTTASPFLEKSSKNNDTTSDTTNKIIISDTIDHFLSTLTMNELLPNDYINEKDVVNVTLIFNETSPTIDATTERILHTLSPSSSTPPKLQECNISSSVIEKYSDSAKPVIPLDEQDTSNENNSNGVSNKITISTTDIMQLQISYNISQNGISSTSGNVPTYPHETSSLLVHQDEVLTNSDSGKTNTLWSPSPVLSNLSELLITTEQTVFNKASVENNSEIFSIQSKDVEYIRTGLDVGADHKNLSINLNTSDVQASENDTELAPSSAMSVEISKEVTEIIIVEDSSTANTSTITTESSILEQEIVNAESLIQDLLDPAIVLAKRSLQSTEIQKNIDRRSRSRSEHSDETKSTGNVTNATPERVQRHTWVDYSDDNYGDLHMAENFCDHHSKHIYRTHYEHKERKFKVDNPHINDSKSRPFKLIPIFSG
ncbi:uncharacterized protein LOC125500190 isoform X2 [Athalia rosae]|uniref:uncharacterized protein LOC125500190 isoform X2 n=1 Tax=Athalia rosae TaxID=37344 RepID=UPI002034A08C|nr:uncharacterized protein LOC125500190 isoform X2 [Athalia rosae]